MNLSFNYIRLSCQTFVSREWVISSRNDLCLFADPRLSWWALAMATEKRRELQERTNQRAATAVQQYKQWGLVEASIARLVRWHGVSLLVHWLGNNLYLTFHKSFFAWIIKVQMSSSRLESWSGNNKSSFSVVTVKVAALLVNALSLPCFGVSDKMLV